ncbi:MAG: hypothetical protein U9R74_09505 [Pseudomonadota bacterium]|nr:hypothetical protein [Pseudomonadota bacterium]
MLMLKDLADSKSLDRDAMASVAGGSGYSFPGFPFKSVTKVKEYDFSADVSVLQGNTQGLENTINNANQSAFFKNPSVYSDPSQYADNTSNIDIRF